MNPKEFFDYLEGKWNIYRTISNYGDIKGTATLSLIAQQTLLYREDVMLENTSTPAYKEYIYSYNNGDIIKYFSDNNIFYKLEFNDSTITGRHTCGNDIYYAAYEPHTPNNFSLKYEISGPNKLYYIHTQFSRISPPKMDFSKCF